MRTAVVPRLSWSVKRSMWARIDERRQSSKRVQPFGLASTDQIQNPRIGGQSLEGWKRSETTSTECAPNKMDTACSQGRDEPTRSLHTSHGSGAVELSPPDPMCCSLEQETSRFMTRAQMNEQPRPSSQSKVPKYSLRSKQSVLPMSGRSSREVSIAHTQPSQHAAVPTLHGLGTAPGQLQPAKRIPDMFNQVRSKRPSDGDLTRTSKKPCVRPTLSAAFCTNPFVQALNDCERSHSSVPRKMASAFDAPRQQPEELSQENVATMDTMMKNDDIILCDESSDTMPCCMAPVPTSPPMCTSERKLTPHATYQLGGFAGLTASPPVHTPPECTGAVLNQPPGAPRKRTKSTSFDSFDSFDACESAFAPRAPEWSPRSAVCRVLKFDDDMVDE